MKCKYHCTTLFFKGQNLLKIICCNISETILKTFLAFSFEICIMFHFGFKKQNTVKDVVKLL